MEWRIKHLASVWKDQRDAEEKQRLKVIAHSHYLRAYMDGEVIKKTGEVVPKEST